jgi:site-specific DNA recombinase
MLFGPARDRLLKTNQIMKTLKWALYARKSTESEERQIQSIDDQLNFLKEMADREELKIVETITESKSAKDPDKRDGFKKLLALINSGKVDGILAWKIDRLSRNPIDSATIQYYLQKGKIKCIKTAERDYLPEDNALVYAVEQGMANQFVRDLSKNVKRGMKSKAEQGWFPNIPPIGYLNSKTREKGRETILTDELRFPIVRKMWDLMLTGNYNLPQVLKIATDDWGLKTSPRKKLGGRPICVSYMWKIFTNIFYTGQFEYGGQIYPGKHTPMITLDEYERVQYILGRKSKPRSKTHVFPYTGFMICGGCGAVITGTEKIKHLKIGESRKYVYYHCTKRKQGVDCAEPRLTKDELEAELLRVISEQTIHPKICELGFRIIREMHSTESSEQEKLLVNHTNNLNDVQRKLNNLTAFLLSETISEDEYKVQKESLLSEKVKCEHLLTQLDSRSKNWRTLTEDMFVFVCAGLDLNQRRPKPTDLQSVVIDHSTTDA